MKVKKPLTDEVADILQPQYFLVEYGYPLGAAAADQLFDGLRVLKVKRLQAQQAHVTGSVNGVLQRAAVNVPTDGAQSREQAIAIVTGVHH
ncbi:hypothetical protein D3C81_1761230 [compost metagenome]